MNDFQPPDNDPFEGMESGDILNFKIDQLRDELEQPMQAMFDVVLDAIQHDAYAEGRRDEQQELSSVLPCSYYMDPPDGGNVTVLEQLQRMAEDARKWREQEHRIALAIECERRCEG